MIQSQKQTIHIGSSNGSATLKYICEVCGELFDSIDFLKQHLSVHTTNSKLVLNSKISSILSFAKNKKICSSAISIPQSMTVFNLKDISSKIGTSPITSQPTTVTSPPIINTNANLLQNKNDTLTKADHNHNSNSNSNSNQNNNNDKNNNSCVLKTVYQLEEPINFYELKNEKLINLTPSILGPSQQLAFFASSELAGSSSNLAQFTSLPYHYSENESIYVCNLCNCTYDSLRSIKAHLWKHSGHRELSYPINDHNRIAESTGKPIVTLKAETSQRKTIRSLQVPMGQTAADKTKPSEGDKCEQVRQSSGGICSALLQVIEKLRETESDQKEAKPSKRKCLTSDKAEASKEPKMRKKRKTSQKVNQLIQIQDQINMNNIKQQEVIKNMLSNQEQECRIETSVVNSLYEDDDDCLLLNNSAKQQDSIKSSTFVCHLCHMFAKDMCQHQCVDHGGEQNEHDKTLDEHHAIYMCHLCPSEQPMAGYHKHQDEQSFYFKYFEDLNLLKSHFESEHCVKNEKSIAESWPSSPPPPPIGQSLPNDLKVTNLSLFTSVSKKNCDMIKLLELLANNDGCEQYVCGLCLYVCYHLPSLKSHMWTHVTNEKFDYSINTSIINAALDYETKISRGLALINNSIRFRKSFCSDDSKEDSDSSSESDELNFSLDKKIEDTLQMINFREMEKKCSSDGHAEPKKLNKSIVAFRCSKCSFETVDLCILRLHKRNH